MCAYSHLFNKFGIESLMVSENGRCRKWMTESNSMSLADSQVDLNR